jgi:hypothetical protein
LPTKNSLLKERKIAGNAKQVEVKLGKGMGEKLGEGVEGRLSEPLGQVN